MKDIVPCLESLAACGASHSFEVIVVDNGSRDRTPALIRRRYPEVRLDATGHNLGFARANNRAITAARGRDFLLLNPDTIVHFHQSMYHFYRKHYCTGALLFAYPLAAMGISMRAAGAVSRVFLQRTRERARNRSAR